MKYIISPVTFFDADIELFATHIINDDSEKRFAFTSCRDEAVKLVAFISIN